MTLTSNLPLRQADRLANTQQMYNMHIIHRNLEDAVIHKQLYVCFSADRLGLDGHHLVLVDCVCFGQPMHLEVTQTEWRKYFNDIYCIIPKDNYITPLKKRNLWKRIK